MSDQETIVQTLERAESRIRVNRFVGRVAGALSLWLAIAILMKVWDLISPFSGFSVRVFWVVWWGGLGLYLFARRSKRQNLGATAAELDRRAHLQDELLSAHWFLSRQIASPWVDLQIQRAARSVRTLDLATLLPRVVPRASYLAAVGAVVLLALSFSPLPFAPIAGFSEPAGSVPSAAQILAREIEALLTAADQLSPDSTLEQFQELMQALGEPNLPPQQVDEQIGEIQDRLDEGNLNVSNIVEGLEDIGADLMQSRDTEDAGRALSQRDLNAAAEAIEALGAELGTGRPPAEDLASTLAEAGENDYAGLEQLAAALSEAAAALENQSGEAAEGALRGAAESLAELADMVGSQQLRNQAASRMEDLEDLLQQEASRAQTGDRSPEQSQRSQAAQSEQEELSQAGPPEGGGQQGTPANGDGAQPELGESASAGGEASESGAAPGEGIAGSPGEGEAGGAGGGDMPLGLGFSPGQVEGPPTSLEVQLQQELVEAPAIESEESDQLEEEASRRERSTLDYRNVPSELTRAQQDLLNQDRIPREYRNLIREYFEAIRGDSAR